MPLSFDDIAAQFDDQRGLPAAALRELVRFVATLGDEATLSIIEPGIGTGRLALPLAMAGHRVTGVDVSRPMLDACHAKAEALRIGDRVALIAGDATMLPVAAGRFDVGLMASLLYLVPEWERVLEELGRVIRPGGKVMLVRERTEEGDALRQWDAGWRSRIEATGFRHQSISPTDDEVIAAMGDRWGDVAANRLASWSFGQTVEQARCNYGPRLRPLYPSLDEATWASTVTAFLEWTSQNFTEATLLSGEVHFEIVTANVTASPGRPASSRR